MLVFLILKYMYKIQTCERKKLHQNVQRSNFSAKFKICVVDHEIANFSTK